MPISHQFSRHCSSALAVFCRAPRLGQVKTRLAATHGDEFALQLYRVMLLDTFSLARDLSPEVETFAFFTPSDAIEELEPFWDGPKIAQCEGDLGEKMLDCLADLRARGYEKVAIIGSDSPDLPLLRLQSAFEMLNQNPLVIGESCDGGFHLIGAHIALPGAIFQGIEWSSATVLQRLRLNTQACFPVANLPAWRDVDDAADLIELRRRLFELGTRAPNTRQFLSCGTK